MNNESVGHGKCKIGFHLDSIVSCGLRICGGQALANTGECPLAPDRVDNTQ